VSPLFSASPGVDFDATGYENIVTCGMFLGLSKAEIAARVGDIEEFSELGEYLSLPMRSYSTGMATRFAFALATTINPEILLLDEGIGTGDARFAVRAAKRTEALISRSHILVIASHSNAMLESMKCNRAILMAKGRIIGAGPIAEVSRMYRELPAPGPDLQADEPVSKGRVAAE
jgi:ABC-type polysaccharide/polyol phosphate transport system ATPase subunit